MATEEKIIPNAVKFLFGGLSGMGASCFLQPMDLVKTRMQLSAGTEGAQKGSFATAAEIYSKGGIRGMYVGLSAGLLRQATYTTTRLGTFTYLFDIYKKEHGQPDFLMKMALGVAAGAIGAFVGTPAEVALIRMTGDGRLPPEKRRNYKGLIDVFSRIVREEGVTKLWRGAAPTIVRAMVVNAAQLGTYAQATEMIQESFKLKGIPLHFSASMVSGLITTIASMPVDIIKTRIQNAAKGTNGFVVVTGILRNEGFFSLWKGFFPYYARIGPHTTLTFMILEQLNGLYRKNMT